MCGIAGFIGRGQKEHLESMADLIAHRGPNAEGFWCDCDKGIYLAHRRLSIIDIQGGSQPMWIPDNTLGVTFNGEIYNHMELRRELESRGYRFQSNHSDTEVLLWSYKEWGRSMVEKLNGMWAFAIYDRHKNELFLSRDRFGKKPLYYSLQNGTFAFASELKALISHPNIKSNISVKALQKYFAYGFIPAPNSLFENVFKLPGGYNLILNISNLNFYTEKYWEFILEPFENIPKNPELEWGEKIRELLSKAVKRRLMSDVPLGIFLSGGIDSSSIAAYASRNSSIKIKTFCIGFKEDSFDESKYSKYAASYLDTDHFIKYISVEKAKIVLPDLSKKLDEPFGDSSFLPTYFLCHETKKHVTVALGGDGADELFAGYDPFHALKLAELYNKIIPKPVHKALRMIASVWPVSHENMRLGFKIDRTLRGLSYPKTLWNPIWLGPLEPSELKDLFDDSPDLEDIYSEAIEYWDTCPQKNIVDKTLQFYTKLYMQENILTKIDRAGMMHSLEIRSPYLDIDLVNFVRKIPNNYKYKCNQTKYILKKSLENILPKNILYRKKHGFGMPVGKWFQSGALRCNIINLPMNKSFFHKLYKEHLTKKYDHRLLLWNYWQLENFNKSI
ncbi:Asparagine synthetase [Desulfonema limicola]|uniref:asparagine synthase (glutamine-hydrolyzing) n=1 Tax=Desulfonema limicola TaxID=45656 RepID=A0A975BAS4_9BACT|nr:asparagine synthase (glutamine-hydrolyzing) [Desulfonema limicola]QTA81891.1 Asparagine synthetase [Desulfonema limicola]